jgi:hypothetical protein
MAGTQQIVEGLPSYRAARAVGIGVDLNAMDQISTNQLVDGALCWVETTPSNVVFRYRQDSVATPDGAKVIAPADGGPGNWLLIDAATNVELGIVRPGVAPNDPVPAAGGPTLGYLMAVAPDPSYVYREVKIAPLIDRTLPILVELSWAPAGAEAGKTVSWQLIVCLAHVGKDVTVIDITKQLLDLPVPDTAAIYQHAHFVLDAADWTADPAADELHMRFERLATASDPTLPPGVHHVEVTQFLQ